MYSTYSKQIQQLYILYSIIICGLSCYNMQCFANKFIKIYA